MNILYLTQFFSPTMGGGEVIFYNMAKRMARIGHHADIVCHLLTNAEENNLDNIVVHRINPIIEHKGGLPSSIRENLIYIINAILTGSQIIRQKKIDIIHTNSFAPVISGSILAKIYNIPLITSVHDVFTTKSPDYWKKWAIQNNASRISAVIGPIFEKITIRMPSDIIHTVSNATKEDIIKLNAKSSNIIIIPNGIDLEYYDSLGFKKDYQNYVLFIGRLVFYKNLDIVISSFKAVAEKLPDAKLVVVGNGPMRDKWEKMALRLGLNQNVKFTGHISQEMKVELLSKCSALLLPSLHEGFGLVLLEAFAMSKPVVVADAKPYYEIVDESVDGFILPAHNTHNWSEKIIFLLSNKTICKNMGSKGRLKVENKFDIIKVVERLESLYNEICSKRG